MGTEKKIRKRQHMNCFCGDWQEFSGEETSVLHLPGCWKIGSFFRTNQRSVLTSAQHHPAREAMLSAKLFKISLLNHRLNSITVS
jgi:hypothetical protein